MRDLCQHVTDRIIATLEAGTPPWVRPWSVGDFRPRNAATQRVYRGINYVLLALEAKARGFAESRWMTYRQAAELGAHVRAGEQGTTVIFYKMVETPAADGQVPDTHPFPVLRCFTVFNVAQIGGLPASLTTPPKRPDWDTHAEVDSLLLAFSVNVRLGGPYAFYDRGDDSVHLPFPDKFWDRGAYYSTALHELTHWTGHPSRLDRDLRGRYGDAAYAMEELIAEMGSAFLCAHFRIDGRLQHPAYLAFWLDVLRKDKRAIFNASTKAQAAADFLLGAPESQQATREAA